MKNLLVIKSVLMDGGFPQELVALIFAISVFLLIGIVYGIIKFSIFKRKYFSNPENDNKIKSSPSDDTGGGVENDSGGDDD